MFLFLFNIFSGCLKDPEEDRPGFSSIPELIIDYDHEINYFKVYVKSAVGDYKYRHIKIRINDTEMVENNTYVYSAATGKMDFLLFVEAAVDIDVIYHSSIHIVLVNDIENNIFLNIIDTTEIIEEEFPVAQEDLPWKKILEQRE